MAIWVSSRLQFAENRPEIRYSHEEIEHEVQHLKRREQVSCVTAIACTILAMIAIAGVIGGGHVVFGALAAIALIAAVYAYFCRQAESSLIAKHMAWNRSATLPAGEKP